MGVEGAAPPVSLANIQGTAWRDEGSRDGSDAAAFADPVLTLWATRRRVLPGPGEASDDQHDALLLLRALQASLPRPEGQDTMIERAVSTCGVDGWVVESQMSFTSH